MNNQLVFLKKWVANLRSGQFVQGYGRLAQQSCGVLRHCCMGVAAETAGIPKFVLHEVLDSTGDIVKVYYFGSEKFVQSLFLNGMIKEVYLTTEDQTILVRMNDIDHLTFNEIADYIENKYIKPLEAA